jgi:uncharacterized protein YcbK (DUF882 family)
MIRLLLTVSLAWLSGGDYRTLRIRNLNTGEFLSVRALRRDGRPLAMPWLRVDHLFQSWRTAERHPISPRLIRVLAQIQRHFAGRQIELVSGYPSPKMRIISTPITTWAGRQTSISTASPIAMSTTTAESFPTWVAASILGPTSST